MASAVSEQNCAGGTANLGSIKRTASKCPTLLSRFRGSMLGALAGDCLGMPFEGEERPISKSLLNSYFEKLHDTSQKVAYKPYTDDSAMTFSVAQSLIDKRQFDAADMATKFVNEYFAQPRRGYGGNIIDVFKALKQQDCKDPFGPARLQFAGRGSYGNGSAMRITPIALFCHSNAEEAINLAYKSSLITHTNELGYNGAILACLAIHKALHCDSSQPLDTDQFALELQQKMASIEKCDSQTSAAVRSMMQQRQQQQQHSTYTDLEFKRINSLNIVRGNYHHKLDQMRQLLAKPSVSSERVIDVLGHFVTAYGSVPTAIYSFLRSVQDEQTPTAANKPLRHETPFQRAVRYAISVGGDTDTIACMTASIAGAYYGHEGIPQALLAHCEGVQQAVDLADSLYDVVEK